MSEGRFLTKLLRVSSSNLDKEESNRHTLQELCIYLLFLTVTTIITLSGREIGMFYFNDTADRLFLQRFSENNDAFNLEFGNLVTLEDWWTYAETTFVEGIDNFENSNSSDVLAVGGNILLGAPRLRQIRVKKESCNVPEVLKTKFTTCYGQYSKSREDRNTYFGKNHYDQAELNSYSLRGSVSQYHGGGYIQKLTNNKVENEKILAELKEILWIDGATRVVLLEFSIFNAYVNLFCNAKLIAEIPATGGIITSSQLQSLKYSPLWNEGEYFQIIWFALFVGLIIHFTVGTVHDIRTFGYISTISSFFKLANITVLLIAYFSIAYVIWHTFYIKSLMKKYSENKGEFLSLDVISHWNLIFIDAIGVCVFIVWIQVFKYMKFNKTMLQFSTTLQRCAKDLLGFSIMFAIVLIAYAYLSILFFGSVLADFQKFSSAFLTLMRMVLGDFDYEHLEKANRILGPIFFLTFILFVFLILMNMFLAIINETYTDVKSDSLIEKETEFEEYIKALLSKVRDIILPSRKKEGAEEIQSTKEINPVRIKTSSWSERKSEPSVEIKFESQNDVLKSLFEILPMDNEDDLLKQRVELLEDKMEILIKRLDVILKSNNPTEKNISNRSL